MMNKNLDNLSLEQLNIEVAKSKNWIIEKRLCENPQDGCYTEEVQSLYEREDGDYADWYWTSERMKDCIDRGVYFYRWCQKEVFVRDDSSEYISWKILKNWSSDISDAWELVEEMCDGELVPSLESCRNNDYKFWRALVYIENHGIEFSEGDTAPVAVCKTYITWKEFLKG